MRTMVLGIVTAIGLLAQTFEVVSIKPLDRSARPGPPRTDPKMVSYPNATLKFLILRAYNIKSYQINGPVWLEEPHFYSFVATIPDGSTQEQVPAMLQRMLAERFGLKAHWETQMQPVLAMVVGKGGPKLQKSDVSRAIAGSDGKPASTLSFSPNGRFEFRGATVGQLAQMLSTQVGRPVLDMTEIQGTYDIDFDANPADLDGLRRMSAGAEVGAGGDSPFPSIFAAVQGLGLKLESRKAPIEHLMIDSLLKDPTEN
jgi:uncharacterized protein (TIGR03435 family)